LKNDFSAIFNFFSFVNLANWQFGFYHFSYH
jgi:hypothetical protein